MHLFIDTTEFVSKHHDIHNPAFTKVRSFANDGLLTLVVPDVIAHEWKQHLKGDLDEWVEKARGAVRKLQLRAGEKENDLRELLPPLAERGASEFEAFLSATGIVRLPSATADITEVVEDYFEGRAPFGRAKKKAEFPDAIAVSSLVRHARENGVQIVVISNDGDWKAACERFPTELVHADSLERALGEAWDKAHDKAMAKELGQLILAHADALLSLQEIQPKLEDVEVTFNPGDRYDAYVEDFTVEEVLRRELFVVGRDDEQNTFEVTGRLRLRVSATICSNDLEYMYRDSDTKDFVFPAQQRERVTGVVETGVDGFLERNENTEHPPGWADLNLAAGSSLELEDFQVTSVRSTADEPEWRGEE